MRWRDIKQNRIPPKSEASKSRSKRTPIPDYPYATILERLKIFITDSFLLAMPIFYIVIYLAMGGREGFREHMGIGWAMILIPLGIVVLLFCVKSGQTPGMKAYEVKMIDVATGKKPSFTLCLLRYLYFNFLFFTVLGLFVPFFRKDRRGLQDLLSGTAMIHTRT